MASNFELESTICSIEYTLDNQSQSNLIQINKGTGTIVGNKISEDHWNIYVVTSYRILPIKHPNEVTGLKLVFKDEKLKTLYPAPDWVKTLWSSDELDLTAIQFSKMAIDFILREEPVFAQISSASRENEKVSTLSYQEGKLNISNGIIIAIDGKFIGYNLINTETCSSGSPLFNDQFQVIGINCNMISTRDKDHAYDQKAILMDTIFVAIEDELNRRILKLKQTNSNEWLNWIESIPKHSLELIGTGGFGRVFKTTEPNGNVIAIKEVGGLGDLKDYEKEATALKKEFELVTALENNPYIIQFFALVEDKHNNRFMIIMEYLEGGSLSDKINSNGKLDKSSSLRYLIQILEGVNFLHKHYIYHSDIKPSNILLTENNDIKICDFGISTIQDRTNSSATLSNLKGSGHYMSPERINGASRSAENDMWSVGATFVTMFTGQTLNCNDDSLFPQVKIAQYKLYIEDNSIEEYLLRLDENDYRRQIISQTLCTVEKRVNAFGLLNICKSLILGSYLHKYA